MILQRKRSIVLIFILFFAGTGCATTAKQGNENGSAHPSIARQEPEEAAPAPETIPGILESENDGDLLVSSIRSALESNSRVGSEQAGKLIELVPDSSYGRFLAGLIYLRNSETENARLQFIRSTELNPTSEHAFSALGEISRQSGDFTKADFYYTKAYAAAATPATANRLALLRIQGGYVESAEEILAKALEEYPQDVMTRNNLAISMDILGRASEGIAILDGDELVDHRLLHTRALLQLKEGRPDRAILDLQSGPGSGLANGQLLLTGIASLQQGKLDTAEEKFRAAIAGKPLEYEGYINLGLTLRRQGKFAQAARIYQEGLTLTSHPDLHLNLGVLYELYRGEPVLALEQYREYLELEGPASERVRGWVEYLEGVVERP